MQINRKPGEENEDGERIINGVNVLLEMYEYGRVAILRNIMKCTASSYSTFHNISQIILICEIDINKKCCFYIETIMDYII